MIGMTISIHFQQFEDLIFPFYSGGACSGVSNRPELGGIVPILLEISQIPTRLQSGHEYPNFEEQLSQANEQNYNKIQANAELQSWWIMQEIQNIGGF